MYRKAYSTVSHIRSGAIIVWATRFAIRTRWTRTTVITKKRTVIWTAFPSHSILKVAKTVIAEMMMTRRASTSWLNVMARMASVMTDPNRAKRASF
jgi:hypothetical protein